MQNLFHEHRKRRASKHPNHDCRLSFKRTSFSTCLQFAYHQTIIENPIYKKDVPQTSNLRLNSKKTHEKKHVAISASSTVSYSPGTRPMLSIRQIEWLHPEKKNTPVFCSILLQRHLDNTVQFLLQSRGFLSLLLQGLDGRLDKTSPRCHALLVIPFLQDLLADEFLQPRFVLALHFPALARVDCASRH
jgi:hypothetical protein